MTWAADLRLRTTAAWRRDLPVQVIPLRYGRTVGRLLPYDAEQRVWVWAAHAIGGITAVTRDGEPMTGWQWRMGTDADGQPLAFVEFGQRINTDGELVAEGVGAIGGRDGVIELAADVLIDLITRWAGLPRDQAAAWSAALGPFRAQCKRLDLRVAGSIEEPITLQRVCAEICASVGAEFSPAARDLSRLTPDAGAVIPARAVIRPEDVLDESAELSDLYTVATAEFAFDAAGRVAAQTCELAAPRAVERWGRRVLELRLPWVRELRVAVGVCQRALVRAARPRWRVAASLRGARSLPFGPDLRPLDTARVLDAAGAARAQVTVEQVTSLIDSPARSVVVSVSVGPAPAVVLVHPRPAAPVVPPPTGGPALPECLIVTDAEKPVLMDDDAYAVADCGPADPEDAEIQPDPPDEI